MVTSWWLRGGSNAAPKCTQTAKLETGSLGAAEKRYTPKPPSGRTTRNINTAELLFSFRFAETKGANVAVFPAAAAQNFSNVGRRGLYTTHAEP